MALIDVGPGCGDGASSFAGGSTYITQLNPSNDAGVIDYICIWAAGVVTGVEVASFYNVGGNDYTTRGNVSLANLAVGLNEFSAPGDFAAFNIATGDFIGLYWTDGNVDADSLVSSHLKLAGDNIPCTAATFAAGSRWNPKIYATGISSGWATGKILGDAPALYAKINGEPIGNIAKINGF